MNARKRLAVVAAIALALSTTGCGSDAAQGTASDLTIRVGVVKASACAPTTLWQEHLPSGAKVVTSYYTAPADQVTALMAGSIDIACTGLTIAVVANSQGQPIRVVGQIARKGTGVIVGKDSGIKSVADLRGKRIGYAPNSIHDVVLRELLASQKLDPSKDVQLVKLGLADMPAALCSGAVDAFVDNEPNSSVALLQNCGTSLLKPYDTPIGAINAGLLTSQPIIDAKPDMLTAVLKAHAAAVKQVIAEPNKVVEVAGGWGADKAATEKSLGNLEFAWSVDAEFVKQYQELADRLQAIGLVGKSVDVTPIVVDTFAKAASGDGS